MFTTICLAILLIAAIAVFIVGWRMPKTKIKRTGYRGDEERQVWIELRRTGGSRGQLPGPVRGRNPSGDADYAERPLATMPGAVSVASV